MPDPKPPRACVFVNGLPGSAKVEIECIAAQA
jgi:enamine deaminase RidA (YjgF/YER057c/UK114 family)